MEKKSEVMKMHWIYRRERMREDCPGCCSYGQINQEDPFKWQGMIFGPPGSPYEDGVFSLSIDLPEDYPSKPPQIKFTTKIFHPNIDEDGTIYVDILEEEHWKPIQTIESLLLSICSLLSAPDPLGSFNRSSKLYTEDWEKYNQEAKDWTRKYAME